MILLRDVQILNITSDDRSAGQVRQKLLTISRGGLQFNFSNGRLEGRRHRTLLSPLQIVEKSDQSVYRCRNCLQSQQSHLLSQVRLTAQTPLLISLRSETSWFHSLQTDSLRHLSVFPRYSLPAKRWQRFCRDCADSDDDRCGGLCNDDLHFLHLLGTSWNASHSRYLATFKVLNVPGSSIIYFFSLRLSRRVKHAGLSKICEDFILQVIDTEVRDERTSVVFQSINIDNVLPLLDRVLETQESIIEEACWRLVNNSNPYLMFWHHWNNWLTLLPEWLTAPPWRYSVTSHGTTLRGSPFQNLFRNFVHWDFKDISHYFNLMTKNFNEYWISYRGRLLGMSLWFLRWCFNLATISPRSTEGQLYKALVCWAEHWISQGRYQSLQEAISEFIPRIEFEHMGREQHHT